MIDFDIIENLGLDKAVSVTSESNQISESQLPFVAYELERAAAPYCSLDVCYTDPEELQGISEDNKARK